MATKHDVTITTGEIRDAWNVIQNGENPFTAKQDRWATDGALNRYRGDKVNAFVGCSGAQMAGWLNDGFYTAQKDIELPAAAADMDTPQFLLNEEEGDMVIHAALAGDDCYRVRWEDQNDSAGLKIRACCSFSAGSDAAAIGAYLDWVLKLADAAVRRGISPGIELWIDTSDVFTNKDGMIVRIPLVEAGQIIDPIAWRAFLSPGAFRSLGFVAMALAADKLGLSVRGNLGIPASPRWDVKLDGDTLDISCPPSVSSFPEARLDALLAAAQGAAV